MYSAGQRQTKKPDKYNPSSYFHSPLFPVTDFDLTMSITLDEDTSLSETSPPSLASLQRQIDDMNIVLPKTTSLKFSHAMKHPIQLPFMKVSIISTVSNVTSMHKSNPSQSESVPPKAKPLDSLR